MRGDELNESLFDGYDCLYIEGYLVQDHELIGGPSGSPRPAA